MLPMCTLSLHRAFLNEYHKTKSKVITLANHKERSQSKEPIETQSKYMSDIVTIGSTKSRLVQLSPFAYIEVVSPTDGSRFAYIQVVSPTLYSKIFYQDR